MSMHALVFTPNTWAEIWCGPLNFGIKCSQGISHKIKCGFTYLCKIFEQKVAPVSKNHNISHSGLFLKDKMNFPMKTTEFYIMHVN